MKQKFPLIQIGFILVFFTCSFFSCKKTDQGAITPARNIEGTWTTPVAVKFYMSTDKCGGFVRFAEQSQKLTWTITSISDNEVIINSSPTYKSGFTVYNVCAQQPVPSSYDLASGITGIISSSHMDLYVGSVKVGSMNITTNNLTGDYDRKICGSSGCSGMSTDASTLILTK
jgi:hypothetical protein